MNELGLIETVDADIARFDHKYENGVIKSLGLLVEEQRTNQIRNNTMQGAVVGTPGTAPTNWTPINRSNLTWSIAGTGIDSGVYYVDLKLSGTANATQSPTFTFESGSQISASNGQTWSTSCFIKLVSGSTTGITQIILAHDERSGTYLTGGNSSNFLSSINSSTTNIFSSCRYSFSRTNTNASTTFLQPYLLVTPTNGAVIDITLRIGMPQTELGSFSTTVIPTEGSQFTRNPDNASITGTNFSSWYNQSEGTVFATFECDNWNSSNQFGKVFTINQAIFGIENNGFWIGNDANNSNTVRYRVRSEGVNQFGPANLTRTSTTVKSAMSVKSSDFAITIDGNAPTTSTSGTLPQVMNSLTIGRDIVGIEGAHLNGHISKLTYYPTRLPNDNLQNLTK
jgi:hypothetical protein